MYPQHPVAGLERKGRPHVTRTVVLLALIGAALITALLVVLSVLAPAYDVPIEHTLPAGGYDPGLYTPFTQAPR